MAFEKRQGRIIKSFMEKDLTLKEKVVEFEKLFGEFKINMGVFNKDMKCIHIQKHVNLFDFLRFVTWKGYKCAVNQILLKLEYAVQSGASVIDSICLDRDFNINVSLVK